MKKKLLSSLLIIFSLASFSQSDILDSENFDALTIGNIGTDITGTTAGQGGFGTFADNGDNIGTTTTNAAATNFQVIAAGAGGTQGTQLTTPNGDGGIRILFKPIATPWGSRTIGNDIVEFQFSLFTGSTTSSLTIFRAIIFGNDAGTNTTLGGLEYNPQTRALTALARLDNAGTKGLFAFDLGAGNTVLVLPENTWVDMGFALNTTTGAVRWKTPTVNATFDNASFIIPGMIPSEYDFLSFGEAGNTAAVDVIFDNVLAKASSTDTLLGIENQSTTVSFVTLYPNPAENTITLNTNLLIDQVEITNSLGQLVLSNKGSFNSKTEFDISNLKSGLYFMNLETKDGLKETKRFIKN